jgi:hypothetical protein
MSYEGYEQHICAAGHRFNIDCVSQFDDEDNPPCDWCNEESVFCNPVDQTNCESFGEIQADDWLKLRLTPQVIEECNLGHEHLTKPATYRIPSKEELKSMRKFFDENGELQLCE